MKIQAPAASVPGAAERTENPHRDEKLMEMARKFEALFVHQMVSVMQKSVNRGGLVPESHAEKVYRGMLDMEHSQQIAESEQIGLSRLIYDHLLRLQMGR